LGGIDSQYLAEVEVQPEPPAIGPLNQYFGGALGLDFGRYLGVEVTFEGYETNLEMKGVGSMTEYTVYAVVPQARLRYPLLDGRLVPYLLAGVGAPSASPMTLPKRRGEVPGVGRVRARGDRRRRLEYQTGTWRSGWRRSTYTRGSRSSSATVRPTGPISNLSSLPGLRVYLADF
jgi:hypothetical protein